MELEKLNQELQNNETAISELGARVRGNLNILREELRRMLSKKQTNRQLPLSRKHSLCKIISMVYTYAYHLFFDHSQPLHSLLVPLFHYFKIGYGEIKKNDLYLRMLYFLSQVICHQSESPLFLSLILMLGLDLDGKLHQSTNK